MIPCGISRRVGGLGVDGLGVWVGGEDFAVGGEVFEFVLEEAGGAVDFGGFAFALEGCDGDGAGDAC